jgi:hypothetical protein
MMGAIRKCRFLLLTAVCAVSLACNTKEKGTEKAANQAIQEVAAAKTRSLPETEINSAPRRLGQ